MTFFSHINSNQNNELVYDYKPGLSNNLASGYLFFGYSIGLSHKSCLNFDVFNKEIATEYNEKSQLCLNPNNLIKIYSIGNLINMEEKIKKNCLKNIQKKKFFIEKPFFDIYNDCFHPKWDYEDLWENIVNNLRNSIQNLENSLESVNLYIDHRKRKRKCIKNGIYLQNYFNDKLKLSRKIFFDINEMKLYNKKKRKLQKALKRKIKE